MGKTKILSFAVLSVMLLLVTVEAITNAELYEILTENADGDAVVIDEDSNDDITLDADDVTMYFHGDGTEDVDLDYLANQILGVHTIDIDDIVRDGEPLVGGCSCDKTRCSCCTSKTFSAKVLWKKVKAKLSACITIEYLKSDFGVRLTFVVNGKTLCRKEFSLRHPPALCYNVPGLGKFARVCAEIYDVDFARKRFCVRVTGVIDVKVKKWKFSIKIDCLRIRMGENDQEQVTDDDMITSQEDQLPVFNEN